MDRNPSRLDRLGETAAMVNGPEPFHPRPMPAPGGTAGVPRPADRNPYWLDWHGFVVGFLVGGLAAAAGFSFFVWEYWPR